MDETLFMIKPDAVEKHRIGSILAEVERAGFEILRMDYASDHLHVGYVAKPGTPVPDAIPSRDDVRDLWREIRFVQNAPRS